MSEEGKLVAIIDNHWFEIVDEWGLQNPDKIIDPEGGAIRALGAQGVTRWLNRRLIEQVYYDKELA